MQGHCSGEILTPEGDDRKNCRCTYCAPAEPDAAQEAAMDELVHLRQEMEETEPEAPEDPPCPSCGQQDGTWFDRSVCPEPCGSAHNRCSNCGAVTGDACLNEVKASEGPACTCQIGTWDKFDSPEDCEAHGPAMAPKAPSRPPFTLTYVLASGETYEVAIPGDATVRALDGALTITHGSAVQALIQIRPMED